MDTESQERNSAKTGAGIPAPCGELRCRGYDLHGFAAHLERRLRDRGVAFSRGGFAVLRREWCLQDIPDWCIMRPLSKASQTPDPSRTLLCPFEDDDTLVGHLRLLPERLPLWRRYAGVCGFDLSPCVDRPVEEQRFSLCVNAMVACDLAAHGIPVVPNIRIGGPGTLDVLDAMPRGVPYAMGTLGCARDSSAEGELLLRWKLHILAPSEILAYGALPEWRERLLRKRGIPFRVFPDYRTMCFAGHGRAA